MYLDSCCLLTLATILISLREYVVCGVNILSLNDLHSPAHGNISDIFETEDGSGEGEVHIEKGQRNAGDTILPHLVVTDTYGRPCLLATLNATLQVSYRVPEVIVHETYIAFADIQLPEDVTALGECSPDVSSLLLEWGNRTFEVNLTFTRQDPEEEGGNSTWSLTAITVTYDLGNTEIFKASTTKDIVTVGRHHMTLFTTQVGNTHRCEQDFNFQIGGNEQGVLVTFHKVIVAAFGVTSSEFPSGTDHCSKTGRIGPREEIFVPLIVASILSFLAISIVIAYTITRRVNKAREQSTYKPMQ